MSKMTSSSHAPIACTLTAKDAAAQVLEWTDLQGQASNVVALATGARMYFSPALEAQVADLAGREATCCAFLSIRTEIVDDRLVLDVTSNNPDALPVISRLAGLSEPRLRGV